MCAHRLLNLMMVGLQHEPDRKDRLAASSGAEHLLGTTGFGEGIVLSYHIIITVSCGFRDKVKE
jgi:hypothetical protein